MTATYQLVYYVPDVLLGERVLLGAVVSLADGAARAVAVPPQSLQETSQSDRLHHFRALLKRFAVMDARRHAPSMLGPEVELGETRAVPDVDEPVAWIHSVMSGRTSLFDWITEEGRSEPWTTSVTRGGSTEPLSVRVRIEAPTDRAANQYEAWLQPVRLGELHQDVA